MYENFFRPPQQSPGHISVVTSPFLLHNKVQLKVPRTTTTPSTGNVVLNFALLFETLLALILIYIPGLNNGLQLEMLHPLMFLCPMPFVLFMLLYDEVRKAIIRKHPDGWMNTETTF